MHESITLNAFVIGIVSAISLPLGAITIKFWKPSDRVIAILMSFGGGALLAALTLDLAASALDKGHFNALAIGAIVGGILFILLNRLVNDYGGFMRKVSTTTYYLRRKQYQRMKSIVSQLNRVDLFQNLNNEDYRILSAAIRYLKIPKGGYIYQAGDPPDFLYIVLQGEVEIFAEKNAPCQPITLQKYDVFAARALIIGSHHIHDAYAKTSVTLLSLSRNTIENLLFDSLSFRQAAQKLISDERILSFLIDGLDLGHEKAQNWIKQNSQSLMQHGVITAPMTVKIRHNAEGFLNKISQMQHILLLQNLSARSRELLSERLLYKCYAKGKTFYQQNDQVDRMYIIDSGEVHLHGVASGERSAQIMQKNDIFGDISMITGARHSVTAVAVTQTCVWELRKMDFERLFSELPDLPERLKKYVHRAIKEGYLVNRQQLDHEQSQRWAQKAMHNIDNGLPVPAAANLKHQQGENSAAPLAIWTGILLDGIPESLVIGASMLKADISLSLILGLFLSNYPEALSSSTGMHRHGMPFSRIVMMWTSIMIFTGIGAAIGSIFFIGASDFAFALVEGIAVGAMLTMIAETMMPEAYLKGGSVVGISTLLGFLLAIFTKTIE